MQKKVLSGMKGGLAVFSSLLLAICLVSTASAKKPSTYQNQNLPNGRPFQILQNEINTLTNDVNTLTGEVAALQSQINQLNQSQYEVVKITSGAGTVNLPIAPSNFSILEGGKDVRFEITFVPSAAATPTDTFIMEAVTSSQPGGSLSFIGTSSDGSVTHGNAQLTPATTFPATIATINGIGSLAATSDVAYEINQASTAPAGTYYVKIIY